jgi:hypothetical protein
VEAKAHIEEFALIIGAMKAGTTSLFHYLSQHPQIAACSDKEPNFFGDERLFERGLPWYESLWEWQPHVHRVALEATTHYSKRHLFPHVTERIAQTERRFKFIYILRDPIERLESHLTHSLREGDIARRRRLPEHASHVNTTRYGWQLQAYEQHFSRSDILLLDAADLRRCPGRILEEVFGFVGVATDVEVRAAQRKNVSADRVREHSLWRFLKRSRRLESWVTRRIPARLRKALRSVMGEEVPRQKIDASERTWVLEELRVDLLRLERDYGFDISRWTLGRDE